VPDQSLVKDIGELTFGRRKVSAPTGGEVGSVAANIFVDQRQRVSAQQITSTPWRNICDLLITANNGTRHTGTAWFISPRTLVTAGHCLFVHDPGMPIHGLVRRIRIMPARDGELSADDAPFGWAEVTRDNLLVHPQWEQGNIDFDYGAIVLPEPLPGLESLNDKFNYAHFNTADLDESTPTLSGYPDDQLEGTQWFEVNRIKEVATRRVFYKISTESGQSGSPLSFTQDGENIACAIHTWGDSEFNSGVRINAEVLAQLDAWRVD
jgi:glutamyl endopeptidase